MRCERFQTMKWLMSVYVEKAEIRAAVASGGLIIVLWILAACYRTFVLGECDAKLGCIVTFQLAGLISGMGGLLASLSFLTAGALVKTVSDRQRFTAAGVGAFVLSCILLPVARWDVSVAFVIIGWCVVCTATFAMLLGAMKIFLWA